MRNLVLLSAGAFVLGIAAPAGAVVTTFATYTQIGSDQNIAYAGGTPGGTIFTTTSPTTPTPGAVQVRFNFGEASLIAAGFTDLLANYTLDLNTTSAPLAQVPGFVVQTGFAGTFSFTYAGTSPLTVNGQTFTTGANLLSGTIGQGTIFGQSGSSVGAIGNSTQAGGNVTFTSDVLGFTTGASNDATIGLNAVVPGLFAGSAALTDFRASSTGSFGTDLVPIVGTVPEPASWAMMVLGFGLAGGTIRRRTGPRTVFA